MTVYVMNTTGVFTSQKKLTIQFSEVSIEHAREVIDDGFISAVGHESTANLISQLLDTEIPLNRYSVDFKPGDIAICFQISPRPPEGVILTELELTTAYNYSFRKLLIQS
jgi:hypothetical protein